MEAAQANTSNLEWLNIVVVLAVGLAQAIVLYITVKEMRRGREAIVTPYLTLKAAGDRMDSYSFKMRNEGAGLAINIRFYLNNMLRASGELDLIPTKEEKAINIDLSRESSWMGQTEHLVYLRFVDIYEHEFLTTFIIQSIDSDHDRMPIRDSLKLRSMTRIG